MNSCQMRRFRAYRNIVLKDVSEVHREYRFKDQRVETSWDISVDMTAQCWCNEV